MEKNHIIIGTAGHIDHGKTALIRALTGRETDTLKEEKTRGISIDLGFTYFDLEDGTRAGMIDVPGHEKFLSNMMAGVCGMDLVLLVIALDEGIMPQTKEHMEILQQLNVTQGILVLTKADLVDEEWRELMQMEIKESIHDTVFADWPFILVSARTGEGIENLKKQIQISVLCSQHTRIISGHFRLPVDRVISLKGLGTVIAGTMLEGMVHTGEEIELYPSMKKAMIRSIQVHGETQERGVAGQRVALLLSNIRKEEVRRGYVAAYPDTLELTERLDVRITLAKETEKELKNQTRLHLHIGTSAVCCRVVLLQENRLGKGETGYAQLVLEEPLALKKGDHFVLRFYSPVVTIGGGIVLDEVPKKHQRKDKMLIRLLNMKEENQTRQVLLALLDKTDMPLDRKQIEQKTKISREELDDLLQEIEEKQEAFVLQGKKKYYWSFLSEGLQWDRFCKFLEEYHKIHPYRLGASKAEIKSNCFRLWIPPCFDSYLNFCRESQKLRGERNCFSLARFFVKKDERTERLKQKLLQRLQVAGTDFVRINEVKPEKMSLEEYEDLLSFFVDEKTMIRISDDFYTTPQIAAEIEEKVLSYFQKEEILSFSSLRDLLRTSRRSAKPLMAYLDERKITRWCGKETERKKQEGDIR